jgi:glycosyltransferase involved in cell wall biosynthesis
LHGYVPLPALRRLMQRAHVLAVPSTHEGFGIAYLEGMGYGLPAIAASAGGASDLVQPGLNGYLIEPGNTSAIHAALSALARDRALLARMGVQALHRFERQPTWFQTTTNVRKFLTDQYRPGRTARTIYTDRGRSAQPSETSGGYP